MLADRDYALEQSCDEGCNRSKDVKPIKSGDIRQNLVWKNILQLLFFHVGFVFALIVYGFGLSALRIKWFTVPWTVIYGYASGLGVTAGAHRLWSHRSYKANLSLRIMLMIMYSATGMNTIFDWVKDHRIHHKYSETNADPHNAKRGFFFSHVGWIMYKRHPEYLRIHREIDLTDIIADPVVMFNKKYEWELYVIFWIIIPVAIPVIFWGETLMHAILTQCFIRYVMLLHSIWSVNSVAHLWGSRPYNRMINPRENFVVSFFAIGEGYHNYHHTFPWDYKASEFLYFPTNLTRLFIYSLSKIGWAYDLREPSPAFVKKVMHEIGDKSNISSKIH